MSAYAALLLKQQQEQNKTTREIVKALFYALALFLAGFLILFLAGFGKIGLQTSLYVKILWIPGIILLLVGGIRLLVYPKKLLAPKRKLTCPACSTSHTIWKKVRFLACTQCLLPLFIDEKGEALIQYQCEHCGKSFACTLEEGSFRCLNCGAHLTLERKRTRPSALEPCVVCQFQHPQGLFACPQCDTLKMPADPALLDTSLENMLARGQDGLLWHWQGKLEDSRQELEKWGNEDIDVYFHILYDLIHMLGPMAGANLLEDDSSGNRLMALVKELDRIYAKSLLKTYAAMKAYPEKQYLISTIEELFRSKQPAILRQNLQHILPTQEPDFTGIWHRPLINRDDYTSYAVKYSTYYSIENPDRLLQEAFRIDPGLEVIFSQELPQKAGDL